MVLYRSPECWGYAGNLEIQEHSMLYKLPPIQKHQEQIWPGHKNGQGNPGSSFEKRPRAWVYNHLVQILAAFQSFYYSRHFVPAPERPFCLIYYFIWYFVIFFVLFYIKPQGKKSQPLGTIILMEADVTKWIKSCLLPCFGTFKIPILMFISKLVFRPECQNWNPVWRDTKIYVRRLLNASRISKTQLNSSTINPS